MIHELEPTAYRYCLFRGWEFCWCYLITLQITIKFHGRLFISPLLCLYMYAALKMNTANSGLSGPFTTKPVGVYSIQNNQYTNSVGSSVAGDNLKGYTTGATQKPAGRKPTPANPHHVDHRGPLHHPDAPTLPPTIEVNEVDSSDDGRDCNMTLSPAAQAHSLSLFLSSSTSDSGKLENNT